MKSIKHYFFILSKILHLIFCISLLHTYFIPRFPLHLFVTPCVYTTNIKFSRVLVISNTLYWNLERNGMKSFNKLYLCIMLSVKINFKYFKALNKKDYKAWRTLKYAYDSYSISIVYHPIKNRRKMAHNFRLIN